MKKKFKVILSSIAFLMTISLLQLPVYAAGFSVSKSASSVAPGGTFTVSVSVSGEGRFNFSASNGTVSSSSQWIAGSGSISVKAGSSGTVTVSVTASDVSASDGETVISGTHSVSVAINAPASGGNTTNSNNSNSGSTTNNTDTTTQQTEEKKEETKKSNVNTLASLTVSAGELSPAFDGNNTNYEVNVDAKVTSITIDAKATDAKASVSGTGEHALQVGANTLQVVCKAEDGSTKTYTITVNVDETPQVYLKLNKQKLGVVRNVKDLGVPESFEATTIKIDGNEVTAYHSNNMNKTILYLVNEKGEKNFYLYDEKEGVISIFIPVTVLGRNVYIIDVKKNDVKVDHTKFNKIQIDNNTFEGWTFTDDKNYSLIMVMNQKGEKVIYQYEATENTLQLYHQVKQEQSNQPKQQKHIMTYVFAATTVVFALISLVLIRYFFIHKKSLK
ncbi:MAG: cadherin-like beta sandwich domain-containing protein [Bacillota bacterium]|nr:cadherin-like beta sandwich domain-containing protein [Bacillota bacterium]